MGANNKIDLYGLGDRVLELRTGNSTRVIAQILTKELEGQDTISQSAVARWLKKATRKRQAAADAVLIDYISTSLPADLNILDELAETYLGIFRHNTGALNKFLKLLQSEATSLDAYRALKAEIEEVLPSVGMKKGVAVPLKLDVPNVDMGMKAGDRLHDILKTKFRFIGVDDGDEEGARRRTESELEKIREVAIELGIKKRQGLSGGA